MIITREIALLYVVHSYEYLLRLLMTLIVIHLDVHLNVLTKKIWFWTLVKNLLLLCSRVESMCTVTHFPYTSNDKAIHLHIITRRFLHTFPINTSLWYHLCIITYCGRHVFMSRLFGLLLIGLVLFVSSIGQKTWANTVNCERTSDDSSGWSSSKFFNQIWPKKLSNK